VIGAADDEHVLGEVDEKRRRLVGDLTAIQMKRWDQWNRESQEKQTRSRQQRALHEQQQRKLTEPGREASGAKRLSLPGFSESTRLKGGGGQSTRNSLPVDAGGEAVVSRSKESKRMSVPIMPATKEPVSPLIKPKKRSHKSSSHRPVSTLQQQAMDDEGGLSKRPSGYTRRYLQHLSIHEDPQEDSLDSLELRAMD